MPRVSSTPESLEALAARCEREEPSRELDAAITVTKLGDGWTVSAAEGWVCVPHHEIVEAPRYTTSLDAAVTLVPEGANWRAGTVYPDFGSNPFNKECAFAKTPALALCAASLRALAAIAKAEGTAPKDSEPSTERYEVTPPLPNPGSR